MLVAKPQCLNQSASYEELLAAMAVVGCDESMTVLSKSTMVALKKVNAAIAEEESIY